MLDRWWHVELLFFQTLRVSCDEETLLYTHTPLAFIRTNNFVFLLSIVYNDLAQTCKALMLINVALL